MNNKQTPTQTVYLAIAEKLIKIGKSEYYRRFTRAFELSKAEGLTTVKRYNFIGSVVKALGYETMLRIAVSLLKDAQHYGNDHFTATAQTIQAAIDLFDLFMEAADKHLNNYVKEIKRIIKEYYKNQQ